RRVVAVVTAQRPGPPVLGQRHAAGGALDELSARAAAQARREAPAVQEQDRLTPVGEAALERAMHRPGDERMPARPGTVPLEVDDLDHRERLRGRPRRKLGERDPAELGPVIALEARRRAAENADRAGPVRAQDREVARVVAEALLLLER